MGKNPIQGFLGVDGGGSNTRALFMDANGKHLSKGFAPGSNPHNIGYPKAASNINEAVQAALENAAPEQLRIASVFCGIAGIRNTEEQMLLTSELQHFQWTRNARLSIDHDVSIAYRAVLGKDSGITLICGTGTSCLGKDITGEIILTSGRTETIDDPGSGYAIGLEGIEAGLLQSTSTNRNDIANLAPQLINLAQEGNPTAQYILNKNADSLIELIRDTLSRLSLSENFNLGIIGSLGTTKTPYQDLILKKIASEFPSTVLRFTNKTPVEAAAELALT